MARSGRLPAAIDRLRRRASGLDGIDGRIEALERELTARIERLETLLHESREETWDRSRERWRSADPTVNLTWDVPVPGEPFIDKAGEHGAFGDGKTILEVGPGYGRLLSAALERNCPFARWLAVDLSAANVEHLRARFEDPRLEFLQGDAETVSLPGAVDTVMSSLTFKHMFPSFEAALRNIAGQMRSGGVAVIDFIEGQRRFFQDDGVTYIRWYSRDELAEIYSRCGFDLVAFDEVQHLPTIKRLLAVGRRR